MVTVGDLMRECRNYFEYAGEAGTFTIANGVLSPMRELFKDRYVAVRGSACSDGVYYCEANGALSDGTDDDPQDCTFTGEVWALNPPKRFIDLAAEATAIEEKNPAGGMQSESFGEYSYTKAGGKNGGAVTWQQAMADSLRPYKRLLPKLGV